MKDHGFISYQLYLKMKYVIKFEYGNGVYGAENRE